MKTNEVVKDPVYLRRWKNLRAIGFLNYQSYLSSDLWRSIRERVLTYKRRCVVCSELATQIHHVNYHINVLRGNDLSNLAPLCASCHRLIEFDGNTKRSGTEAWKAGQKVLHKWFKARAREKRRTKRLNGSKSKKKWNRDKEIN